MAKHSTVPPATSGKRVDPLRSEGEEPDTGQQALTTDPASEALLKWLSGSLKEKLTVISALGFLLTIVHLTAWTLNPEIDIHSFLSVQDYIRLSISWLAKTVILIAIAFVTLTLPGVLGMSILNAALNQFRSNTRDFARWVGIAVKTGAVLAAIGLVGVGMYLTVQAFPFFGLPQTLWLPTTLIAMGMFNSIANRDFLFHDILPSRRGSYASLQVGLYAVFGVFMLTFVLGGIGVHDSAWSSPVTIEMDDARYEAASVHFVLDGFVIFRTSSDTLMVVPRNSVRSITSLARQHNSKGFEARKSTEERDPVR